MSPDERRQAIIAATRPLLVARGGQFTIKEVAEAAGIAEGTIFRVFASKQDLMHAVVADILDTASLCRRIEALPDVPDFTAHLTALITILSAYVDATHAAIAALRLASCEESDSSARLAHGGHHQGGKTNFHKRITQVRDAIIASITPWEAQLRLSPEQAAFLIQSTAFSALHFVLEDHPLSDPALLASTLTHGIYKD